MTKEELAAKLNGREYGHEMTNEEEKEAAHDGLVVIFGYSDDNIEFRGAIDDEQGGYEGGDFCITPKGLLLNECNDDDCPYFRKLQQECKHVVSAIWDKNDYSWWIESNTIPYAPFDIMEDGEKYCRGIVFELPVSQ